MSAAASYEFENIIGSAYKLAKGLDRDKSLSDARNLANTISHTLWKSRHAISGEAGSLNWVDATRKLVESKHINRIRAWMLAEVVATGAASAHELANVEPISDERVYDLTLALATGSLALTDDCYLT